VTASADQGARQTVRRIARINPHARIVVTGCYATRRPDEFQGQPNVLRVVRNDDKARLVAQLSDDVGLTSSERYGDGEGSCGASIEPGVAGRTAFTLRVQTGCAQPCSYCIIPTTRGVPRSLDVGTVLSEVERVVAAGFKEIALTGVHLGSYGRDLTPASSLVELLRAIERRHDLKTVPYAADTRHAADATVPYAAVIRHAADATVPDAAATRHAGDATVPYAAARHPANTGHATDTDGITDRRHQYAGTHVAPELVDTDGRTALNTASTHTVLNTANGRAVLNTAGRHSVLNNTSSRGRSLDPPAPEVRFRISSLEPMDCSREIVDLVASDDAFAPHFHLPLQHASDRLLTAMRRPYTLAYYADLVDAIRHRLPNASIGSDVIVGFPGETGEDFTQLCDYLARSPLTHLHVFPYSDRPGTAASAMTGRVHGSVTRERASRVREIGRRLTVRFRESQLGTVHRGLTIEDGTLVVTGNYLKVRIPPGCSRNEWVRVRVTDVGETMRGEIS
jgi:tRNA A37 methylthiotransferase MiaB